MVASLSLLSGWIGHSEISLNIVLFRTVMFFLGVGATWVVNFDGCGLPGLVCCSKSYFVFLVLYLCFDGTWVHVTTEKDLPKLICICGNCCVLPMFWWYLGTCYD